MTEIRGTAGGCDIFLRSFSSVDLGELVQVENECFEPTDRYTSTDFLERLSLNPIFIVVVHCGNIVGYSLATVEGPSCYIDSLAVRPGFRRRGIGMWLLLNTLKECRSRGTVRAWLEVSAGNVPAINLYTKAGFYVIGREKEKYGEDYVYMMAKEPI